jgi:hypothetical protein
MCTDCCRLKLCGSSRSRRTLARSKRRSTARYGCGMGFRSVRYGATIGIVAARLGLGRLAHQFIQANVRQVAASSSPAPDTCHAS